VIELIVILLELDLPSGCVGADFVRFTPIGEVTMVCPDDDRDGGASEEMRPVSKGTYDA